ncbi:MAG: hypothetical protein JXA28_00905 [Bacteroidetes bacterium]|nr:hypothetical protein [Bacteroidota bacterium]
MTERTQSYTALSPYHFLDLVNLFLLVQPFALLMIVMRLWTARLRPLDRLEYFLLAGVVSESLV